MYGHQKVQRWVAGRSFNSIWSNTTQAVWSNGCFLNELALCVVCSSTAGHCRVSALLRGHRGAKSCLRTSGSYSWAKCTGQRQCACLKKIPFAPYTAPLLELQGESPYQDLKWGLGIFIYAMQEWLLGMLEMMCAQTTEYIWPECGLQREAQYLWQIISIAFDITPSFSKSV